MGDQDYLKRILAGFDNEKPLGPKLNVTSCEFSFNNAESEVIWAMLRKSTFYLDMYSRIRKSKESYAEGNRTADHLLMSHLPDPDQHEFNGLFRANLFDYANAFESDGLNPFLINLATKVLEEMVEQLPTNHKIKSYLQDHLPYLETHTLSPLSRSQVALAVIATYSFDIKTRPGRFEVRKFNSILSDNFPHFKFKVTNAKSLGLIFSLANEIIGNGPWFFFRVSKKSKSSKTRRVKTKK